MIDRSIDVIIKCWYRLFFIFVLILTSFVLEKNLPTIIIKEKQV